MFLYEQYRPTTIEQIVGHEVAKKELACVLRRGGAGGRAFWFGGKSGIGKTTFGRIIAAMIADPFFIQEYDTADDVTAAVADEIAYYMTFGAAGKGGRAYIINEAHALRGAIVRKLLGILERIPPKVAFVFTTTLQGQRHLFDNQIDAAPLLSRCIHIELQSNDALLRAFAKRAQEIARAEHLDGQPLGAYLALAHTCQGNFRKMLDEIEKGRMLT
jgi:replication-associated recombination protein RarA